jgi:hypothetical protein
LRRAFLEKKGERILAEDFLALAEIAVACEQSNLKSPQSVEDFCRRFCSQPQAKFKPGDILREKLHPRQWLLVSNGKNLSDGEYWLSCLRRDGASRFGFTAYPDSFHYEHVPREEFLTKRRGKLP